MVGCFLSISMNCFFVRKSQSLFRFWLVNRKAAYLLVTLEMLDFSFPVFLIFFSSIKVILPILSESLPLKLAFYFLNKAGSWTCGFFFGSFRTYFILVWIWMYSLEFGIYTEPLRRGCSVLSSELSSKIIFS